MTTRAVESWLHEPLQQFIEDARATLALLLATRGSAGSHTAEDPVEFNLSGINQVQTKAEIGLTFLSEIENPGVDAVGALPREISTPTTLVGFVSAHAKAPAAAKALLDYLSSPTAASIALAVATATGALLMTSMGT